jgi:hypothetical protein
MLAAGGKRHSASYATNRGSGRPACGKLPYVHLRHPGRIDAALAEVNQLHGTWEGSWSSTDWLRVKDECLRRVDSTYDRLREHFGDRVAEVVYTRLYWEIHRLTRESQRPWDLFRREAQAQADYLARLVEKLRAHRAFAARPGHIVVPDTSAFTRAQPFEQFNWPVELDLRPDVRLVVPILVIEELDKVKSFDRGQDRHRARQALKELDDRLGPDPQRPARVRDHVTVEVLIDDDWHERMPMNDSEIIDQAREIQDWTGRAVTLAAGDASQVFRARARGLNAVLLPDRSLPGG